MPESSLRRAGSSSEVSTVIETRKKTAGKAGRSLLRDFFVRAFLAKPRDVLGFRVCRISRRALYESVWIWTEEFSYSLINHLRSNSRDRRIIQEQYASQIDGESDFQSGEEQECSALIDTGRCR